MNIEKELMELKANVTPFKTIKFLAGTVISCGAMAAICAALKIPIQSSKGLTKLMMRLGIFILGCKAGDVAEEYFGQMIDKVMETFKEAKEEEKNESNPDE